MLLVQPLANFYLGGFGGISKSWLTTVFGLVALQVCCASLVVIYLCHRYSLVSILFGCGFF